MRELITSNLDTKGLHELTAGTISNCSDGTVTNTNNHDLSLIFYTDDMHFFELNNRGEIFLNKLGDHKPNRTILDPGTLKALFHLFESATDLYEYIYTKDSKE